MRQDIFEDNFSNARYVRNALEQAIRKQAVRLLEIKELTREDIMTLTADDFVWPNT